MIISLVNRGKLSPSLSLFLYSSIFFDLRPSPHILLFTTTQNRITLYHTLLPQLYILFFHLSFSNLYLFVLFFFQFIFLLLLPSFFMAYFQTRTFLYSFGNIRGPSLFTNFNEKLISRGRPFHSSQEPTSILFHPSYFLSSIISQTIFQSLRTYTPTQTHARAFFTSFNFVDFTRSSLSS